MSTRPSPPSRCPKCHAPISWWRNQNRPGRRLPVDPSSDPEKGTIRKIVQDIAGLGPIVYGRVLSGDELADAIASNEMLFTHHSSTCSALRPHNRKPPGLTIARPSSHERRR